MEGGCGDEGGVCVRRADDLDRFSHRSYIGLRGRGVQYRSRCRTRMGHEDHRSWMNLSVGMATSGLRPNSELLRSGWAWTC